MQDSKELVQTDLGCTWGQQEHSYSEQSALSQHPCRAAEAGGICAWKWDCYCRGFTFSAEAEQPQRELFHHPDAAVQEQMVHLTVLPWNAPKMIYHVLSTLSGPPCPLFHLWCPVCFLKISLSISFLPVTTTIWNSFLSLRLWFCCQRM